MLIIEAVMLAFLAAAGWVTQTSGPFQPHPLSAFDKSKAAALLDSRLPCLGCHELNGRGGRIGPPLNDLRARRSPDYVYSMITDPQRTAPGTVMPRVPMSRGMADLIANYVLDGSGPAALPEPVRPMVSAGAAPTAPAAPADPAALYAKFCSACHGTQGNGDGPNAGFLPVRPTAHASAEAMSARSDDALFDTIYAGGYVMNRSNFMPPFGQTLTREQLWVLVRHIRSLCHCQGPAWSRNHQ